MAAWGCVGLHLEGALSCIAAALHTGRGPNAFQADDTQMIRESRPRRGDEAGAEVRVGGRVRAGVEGGGEGASRYPSANAAHAPVRLGHCR